MHFIDNDMKIYLYQHFVFMIFHFHNLTVSINILFIKHKSIIPLIYLEMTLMNWNPFKNGSIQDLNKKKNHKDTQEEDPQEMAFE